MVDGVVNWRSIGELELPPILAAARDAFYEAGYHGTSVRDIARRVGVTVPALYYHYENKEALLLAILDDSLDHLTRMCQAAVAEAGPRADDRFLNIIECITLYEANARRTTSVDLETRLLSPGQRSTYAKKRKAIENLLLVAVEDGVEAGLFRITDAEATTRAILGMLQAIPRWYHPEGRVDPHQLAAQYKDICVHTVGARASVMKKALKAG
jgi:AcrR family transcriptional regulator